ncbi:MAG: NADH-quinone oxidoreductase subunit M, partial [Fimbriimonadaceae bacterium]|nr:NADH-quinone oxidoreductase subunit M [Chitinophagales bacterium]
MNLNLLIALPVLTALAVVFCKGLKQIRTIAFIGSALQLILCCILLCAFQNERATGNTEQFIFQSSYAWFPSLNINFHIGVDGISIAMILLTACVVLAGVLVSWKEETMSKEFFLLLIILSAGAYGFFISLDLFTLFFFLEVAVIPKFLLIGIWGSGKKEYSAMKLALMLMGGSALVFVGILGTYYSAEYRWIFHTFDLRGISEIEVPYEDQLIFFPFLFLGFGIFGALFPFHTWVPDGHSSAPTAASMFLAGISMKLGG